MLSYREGEASGGLARGTETVAPHDASYTKYYMKGAKSKVANMASTTDLILESCASLRLSSIPTEWADHVWQSEFCESSGLPEILQQQAPECEYFKEAFATLLHGCRRLLTTKEQSTSTNEGQLFLWASG